MGCSSSDNPTTVGRVLGVGRLSAIDQTTGHRQKHIRTCVLHNYVGILYWKSCLMHHYKYVNNFSVRQPFRDRTCCHNFILCFYNYTILVSKIIQLWLSQSSLKGEVLTLISKRHKKVQLKLTQKPFVHKVQWNESNNNINA